MIRGNANGNKLINKIETINDKNQYSFFHKHLRKEYQTRVVQQNREYNIETVAARDLKVWGVVNKDNI